MGWLGFRNALLERALSALDVYSNRNQGYTTEYQVPMEDKPRVVLGSMADQPCHDQVQCQTTKVYIQLLEVWSLNIKLKRITLCLPRVISTGCRTLFTIPGVQLHVYVKVVVVHLGPATRLDLVPTGR